MAEVLSKKFENGKMSLSYEKIGKTLTFDPKKCKPEVRARAEEHGWLQRFGDLQAGDKEGRAKYEAAMALRDHLYAGGDWELDRGPNASEVIEAINRIDPAQFPVETLTKAYKAKPELLTQWRSQAAVQAMIQKIRAEKAAKRAEGVDGLEINLK